MCLNLRSRSATGVRRGQKRVWTVRGRRDVASRWGGGIALLLNYAWPLEARADAWSLSYESWRSVTLHHQHPGTETRDGPPARFTRRWEETRPCLPACHAEQWPTVSGILIDRMIWKDTSHPTSLNDVSTPTHSCRDNKNTQDKKKNNAGKQRCVMSSNGMFRYVSRWRICSAFALNELS